MLACTTVHLSCIRWFSFIRAYFLSLTSTFPSPCFTIFLFFTRAARRYPATPLLLSRARFCISAGHTREDMDFALEQIEAVADLCHIRYRKYING